MAPGGSYSKISLVASSSVNVVPIDIAEPSEAALAKSSLAGGAASAGAAVRQPPASARRVMVMRRKRRFVFIAPESRPRGAAKMECPADVVAGFRRARGGLELQFPTRRALRPRGRVDPPLTAAGS